jgi:hypothetical protein
MRLSQIRLTLPRLPIAVAVLLIALVPSSMGFAQAGPGGFNQVLTDGSNSAVYCGHPGCCSSVCRTGGWYPNLQMCLTGGNGSCMSCDANCY